MGPANQKRVTGGWRAFLSIVLAAALALCMTPVGALEAQAASTTKSYVYNYVYGTYQGKYVVGFTWSAPGAVNVEESTLKEVAIVSATEGVTLQVKASTVGTTALSDWANELTSRFSNRNTFLAGVIGVPTKDAQDIVYQPYTLAGKKLSNSSYNQVGYFQSSQMAGGTGTVFSRVNGTKLTVDVFNGLGAKVQTITQVLPSLTFAQEASVRVIEENNTVELYVWGGVDMSTTSYLLRGGKFVSGSSSEETEDSWNSIGDGVMFEEEWESDGQRAFLVQPGGKRIELPRLKGRLATYRPVAGFGVCGADSDGVIYVYNKQGKLLGTEKTEMKGQPVNLEKSAVPGVWVLVCKNKPIAAYNISFKEIARKNLDAYRYAKEAGSYQGKPVYLAPANAAKSLETRICVDSSMNQIKVGGNTLQSNYDTSTPIHTFSNGRSVVIAKNSKGNYGVIDTAGNVLVPFSYSDYANVGGGDYIMMKASKGWQFVKVSQFASGKAVKDITYTVGKLKYKVTSTSSKNRTVTAVGHVSGAKAKGKLSIPSTVKIGGQKFKVTEVGASAFKGSAITSVTVGASVTKVGASAFSGCKKLTKATLGKKVKSLGKNTFSGCKKLKTVTIKSKVLKSVGKNALKNVYKKAKIKVPSSKVKAYKKLFKSSTGFKKTMKVTK